MLEGVAMVRPEAMESLAIVCSNFFLGILGQESVTDPKTSLPLKQSLMPCISTSSDEEVFSGLCERIQLEI